MPLVTYVTSTSENLVAANRPCISNNEVGKQHPSLPFPSIDPALHSPLSFHLSLILSYPFLFLLSVPPFPLTRTHFVVLWIAFCEAKLCFQNFSWRPKIPPRFIQAYYIRSDGCSLWDTTTPTQRSWSSGADRRFMTSRSPLLFLYRSVSVSVGSSSWENLVLASSPDLTACSRRAVRQDVA